MKPGRIDDLIVGIGVAVVILGIPALILWTLGHTVLIVSTGVFFAIVAIGIALDGRKT